MSGASIVILNWNGRDLLARCLPSIQAATRDSPSHELIVVDNGSTDDSIAFVRAHFPSIQVIRLPNNVGFAAGNNAGIRAARSDIVVLLNNDMLVDPEFLPPLLAAFAQHANLFAATAQVFFQDATRRREETGRTCAQFVRGMLAPRHADVDDSAHAGGEPVLWAGGGSTAYDRSKLLALGGFDELFEPAYVEDLDLSYRAWQRGWPSVLVASSKVWHEHRATSRRRFGDAHIDALIKRNLLLFMWRHFGWSLLAEHLAWLPLQAIYLAGQYGWWRTTWILLSALTRVPRVMRRRAAESRPRPRDDRSVLAIGSRTPNCWSSAPA